MVTHIAEKHGKSSILRLWHDEEAKLRKTREYYQILSEIGSTSGSSVQYRCNICGLVVGREKDIQLHIFDHAGEGMSESGGILEDPEPEPPQPVLPMIYKIPEDRNCALCGAWLADDDTFISHVANNHFKSKLLEQVGANAPFRCLKCGKSHKTKHDLFVHIAG